MWMLVSINTLTEIPEIPPRHARLSPNSSHHRRSNANLFCFARHVGLESVHGVDSRVHEDDAILCVTRSPGTNRNCDRISLGSVICPLDITLALSMIG